MQITIISNYRSNLDFEKKSCTTASAIIGIFRTMGVVDFGYNIRVLFKGKQLLCSVLFKGW
jgi:hypothetical protein